MEVISMDFNSGPGKWNPARPDCCENLGMFDENSPPPHLEREIPATRVGRRAWGIRACDLNRDQHGRRQCWRSS